MPKIVAWDFGGINNAISNIATGLKEQQDRQTIAALGGSLAKGDYNTAMQQAFAMGKPDIGLKLIELKNQAASDASTAAFMGGGAMAEPTTSGGGQTLSGLTSGAPTAPASAGRSVPSMIRSDPVAPGLKPYEAALLNGISGGESGGKYNIRYTPGGGATFALDGTHPGIPESGPAGPSTAAGRYQFTKSTWNDLTGGKVPFTPENQDRMALVLARRDYTSRTGRDLDADLQAEGFSPRIQAALGDTWHALKGNQSRNAANFSATLGRFAGNGPASPTAFAPGGAPQVNGTASNGSAQAAQADRLGSTGSSGQTNALPSPNDGEARFRPSTIAALNAPLPAATPVAGTAVPFGSAVPKSIAGSVPVAPTAASAPLPPSRPAELGGVQVASADPNFVPRVPDDTRYGAPMAAPSAQRPDWLPAEGQGAAAAQTRVAQAPGAPGPSVPPTANHNTPAEAPATVAAGSPAAQSSNAMLLANRILTFVASNPGMRDGARQALLQRYQYLTHYDSNRLDMELKGLQAQESRGKLAMQPLERQGKELSNAQAYRTLSEPTDPDQRGYSLAQSQGYGGSFMDYKLALAKSGANTTVIKDEDARDKTAGAAIGEEIGSYIKAARPAAQSIQQLALMKSALDAGGGNISTGPLAETVLKGKQALSNAFGIDVAGLPETEALQKLGFGLATQAVQAISSRPTQMEFGRALENNPGIFLSRQGNLAMIDILRQQKRQEIDLAALASKKENWDNWSGVVENYYATHPIKSPFDKTKDFGADDVKRLAGQPDVPPPQRAVPPAPAIDALRSNPTLRDQFDAKYGAGSAARALGGR